MYVREPPKGGQNSIDGVRFLKKFIPLLKAAVGAALGDGGLYPARLAMGGGAGYGTALEALRDGSGRCTRRGA